MAQYTPNQLSMRKQIIDSQVSFIKFVNANIINELVKIFDRRYNSDPNHKISKYILDERASRGLSNHNIQIKSSAYGTNSSNSTLLLDILKNNKNFIHLTIHLTIKALNSKNNGIIHIVKNLYKSQTTKHQKRGLYALISVQPIKQQSLIFTINNGYNTPNVEYFTNFINSINSSKTKKALEYEPEIKEEMDVIITVLNRMFDEDNKDYYIGRNINKNKLWNIHPKVNIFLNDINNHNIYGNRYNKGVKINPSWSNESPLTISYNRNKIKSKKKSKRHTYKNYK